MRSDFAHIVRLLVEVGRADVQERNSSTGWVALHEAAFRGHLESVRMLIFLNAPIQPRTQEDDFPRDLAHRYGKKNVVELLGGFVCVCGGGGGWVSNSRGSTSIMCCSV